MVGISGVPELRFHMKEIQGSLLSTLGDSDSVEDLTSRLMTLVQEDPDNADVYQLIVVINNGIDTSHRSFKQVFRKIIHDMITVATATLDHIQTIDNRVSDLEAINEGVKVPFVGKVKLKYFAFLAIGVVAAFIVGLNVAPEATKSVINMLVPWGGK